MMEKRVCPGCGFTIYGRTDKVFCTDQCRTQHYNQKYREVDHAVRKINAALKRNRKILIELLDLGKTEVDEQTLLEMGFDFRYITAVVREEKDKLSYRCYDVGYYFQEPGIVKLLEREIQPG